jgi:hypothetical protein
VKYEIPTTYQSKVMTKVKLFEKVKTPRSRSWYRKKGLAIRNTYVKYESPTTYQSKIMTKVKVLEKVKLQGQRFKIMISNNRSCQKEYTCEV